jgi:predicted SAM-dependent methyltransferase
MTGASKAWIKERPRLYRGALAARRVGGHLRRGAAVPLRRGLIQRYLRTHESRRLHLGAGPHAIPGWLNTDIRPASLAIAYLDATKSFPLPDASMDVVFSEHMIEHVPYGDGVRMLRECARVLRPGGVVRIATPDLAAIVGLYRGDLSDEERAYVEWFVERNDVRAVGDRPAFVINHFFTSWGHRFLYDRKTLREALEQAGFEAVTEHRPGESEHPELRGLERHGTVLGDERWNDFETFVLEARR